MQRNITLTENCSFRQIYTLTQLAARSIHNVLIQKGNSKVDAKSILGVLSLAVKAGDDISLVSDDPIVIMGICEALESNEEKHDEIFAVPMGEENV